MNHIYRSIRNASTGTVTAVSEHAKSCGKKNASGKRAVARSGIVLRAVSAALALSCGAGAHASPTGGTVVAGNATISSESGNTTILQTTQNAALNWQTFDIGLNEAVRFVQPSSSSVALNRVLGADPSSILGSLSSNGKVFIVNPNGILFGTGAQVNVGGLIASTRDIADSDFMAGRYSFNGESRASIVNHGSINADGGYVALLGANVSNQGVMAAKLGSVVLASGNALTLDVAGDGLLSVTVNAGAVEALIHNGGLIQADGGQVLLTARSASSLLPSAVNNTGVVQAQTIENRNGTIRLLGDMQSGTVNVGGTLDASAPERGDGGFIDTSAGSVQVADDARVTTAAAHGLTGSWLIDPVDYNIAASGGNITGAALSSNLASTNVTVLSSAGNSGTAGNVNVNDTVAWSANLLTLNAQNDININTAMNASGSASLALEYGQGAIAAGNTSKVNVNAPVDLPAGNNFSTLQGSNGSVVNYTVLTSLGAAGSTTGTDLQGMGGNLARNYVLGSDIDAAITSSWNAGAGFTPIGTEPARFTGIFDGLGHTVSGLYIDRTGSQFTGLFGYTAAGSMIRNVGSIGGSVTSDSWGTGALVGSLLGTVMNSYATGSVRGFQTAGGLVGAIGDFGAIVGSHATGDVVAYGNGEAGGLVGLIWGNPRGSVTDSYATGNVSSPVGNVGGLIGINYGAVTNSHATGSVNGIDNVGGLIGSNRGAAISNSYATGSVTGQDYVGGLLGASSGTTSNSYATGEVTGRNRVGGLVGYSEYGTITGNHASGVVNASGDDVGGLIGYNYGSTLSGNYTSGAVTGRVSVGGFVGANRGSGYGYGADVLSNNYASGAVTGVFAVGGLIGTNWGNVSDSYATGAVTGDDQIGGLVGGFQSGTINTSYAAGDVTARTGAAGGLVGYASATISNSYARGAVSGVYQVGGILGAMNGGSIDNTYATGSVTGTGNVGGLVGNSSNGTITNTYSTGAVSGTTDVGGMLGSSAGATVTNGFWDLTTSGQATSSGGTGLTTAGLQATLPTGFSAGIWGNVENQTTPYLLSNPGPVLIATDTSHTYYNLILNLSQLQSMNADLAGSYALATDIDASATSSWDGGAGFLPIGDNTVKFTGSFDGLGHVVSNLTINRATTDDVGLFGSAFGSNVNRIGLVDAEIAGRNNVGALFGSTVLGTASHDYASGHVTGQNTVGGLVGYNNTMGVTASYSTSSVMGANNVGGLMGETNGGRLSDFNYASGNVTASGSNVGGLVGYNGIAFVIANSYATGNVTGAGAVGGLVGYHLNGGIDQSYSTGNVAGASDVGGLIGYTSAGSVTNSYWNSGSSGQVVSAGGTALTDAQMLDQANFSGWNFGANWIGYDGHTNPLLRTLMTELTVTMGSATKTYDALAYSGSNGIIYSTAPGGHLLGSTTIGGTSQGATNAGNYTITGSGLYSNQQGYVINYVSGALTVNRANLTVSGTRTYDGSSIVAGAILTATGVAGQSFSVAGAGDTSNLATRNVQTGSTLASLTGLALGTSSNGGLSLNYNALSNTGSSVSVTRAALTLSTASVIKTYDGDVTAGGSATMTSGTLFGADAISGGTFAFTDKNAGIGNKTVTVAGVTVTDGNGGANYDVTYSSNNTSTINRAVLTAIATANDKVYDGNTAATATLNLVGLVGGETLGSTSSAAFNSKDVATANFVTVNSIALSNGTNGGLASNYSLASGQTAVAHVTPKALTATVAAPDKVYDGTTSASATLNAMSGLIGSETIAASGSASFNSKDVGTANIVTVNSTALSNGTNGGLASNYSLASGQTAVAHVTPKALTATVAAPDKVYDGTTAASATLSALNGLIGTETLNASGTATFNSKDVVAANLVTVNSASLNNGTNGGLASNYSLTGGQAAVAHITPRALTVVNQVAVDKVYDGTTTATVRGGLLAGVVAGETVSLNEAGTFATATAGNGIAVTTADTLSGAAAANYYVTQPVGLAANITAVAEPLVPPVVVVPPPVIIAVPPIIEIPAPVPVTATVAYASAVGHATAISQFAPVQVSAPAPVIPAWSAATVSGPIMIDVSGLNLTVITSRSELPAIESPATMGDDDER